MNMGQLWSFEDGRATLAAPEVHALLYELARGPFAWPKMPSCAPFHRETVVDRRRGLHADGLAARALTLLMRRGGQTASDLYKALQCPPPSMSYALETLLRQKLVRMDRSKPTRYFPIPESEE